MFRLIHIAIIREYTQHDPYVYQLKHFKITISTSAISWDKLYSLMKCPTVWGWDTTVGNTTVTGWMSKPGGRKRFSLLRTRPDRPWGPPSLL